MLVEGTGHQPDCSQLLGPHGAPPSPNPQACHVEPQWFFSSSSSPTSGLVHSLFPWWERPFHAGHLPVKGRDAHESPQEETEAPGGRVQSSPELCVPADLAERQSLCSGPQSTTSSQLASQSSWLKWAHSPCPAGLCAQSLKVSDSLQPHGLQQPARLLCPWDSPGRNAGVGCCPSDYTNNRKEFGASGRWKPPGACGPLSPHPAQDPRWPSLNSVHSRVPLAGSAAGTPGQEGKRAPHPPSVGRGQQAGLGASSQCQPRGIAGKRNDFRPL